MSSQNWSTFDLMQPQTLETNGTIFNPNSITSNDTFPELEPLIPVLNVEEMMQTMDKVELEVFDFISFLSIMIAISFILKRKYVLYKEENICIVVFMISTIYRSWNISDEGAFLCYKPASIWNSCFSGRFIATFGEFGILNWILYKMGLFKFPKIYNICMTLCGIAEACSWCGCILRNSKFFCVEYMFWNILLSIIICTNIKSGKYFARFMFFCIVLFNLFGEIPHFWNYKLERETSLFLSLSDQLNPVWNDRIMFFIGYYNLIPLYLLSTAYIQRNK